jgi:hypothetical protein
LGNLLGMNGIGFAPNHDRVMDHFWPFACAAIAAALLGLLILAFQRRIEAR